MKKIFDYMDYQQYLRDFYQEKKDQNSFFSYRYMGQKLDMDPGFIVKVLQGSMHLAVKAIPKVIEFCGLAGSEADYFDTMVKFGRAKTEKEIKLYFDKLVSYHGLESTTIEAKQYRFYTKWYYTAVRALLGYYKFSGDYESLAKKLSPAITAEEARDAVKLLTDLKFIEADESGVYHLTSTIITTGDTWRSAGIRSFQDETLRLARESLTRHPKELRDISTITVSVSHNDLDEIRERAKEFRQSILKMKTGNTEQDVVYQINIQVVPLTEIGGES